MHAASPCPCPTHEFRWYLPLYATLTQLSGLALTAIFLFVREKLCGGCGDRRTSQTTYTKLYDVGGSEMAGDDVEMVRGKASINNITACYVNYQQWKQLPHLNTQLDYRLTHHP